MFTKKEIEFTCCVDCQDMEWIGGKYNVAFTGKMKDEQGLRDYILGKFEELNTMQLITLLQGESYDVVVGNDVRKGVA